MQNINIIVAVGNYIPGKGYPIGKGGGLPWHSTSDLRWFKQKTLNHPVIMGRKTYESIGKPLQDRLNIVVTRNKKITNGENDNPIFANSLENAITLAKEKSKEDIFIIGGSTMFKEALKKDLVDNINMDMLSEKCEDADTFFDFDTSRFETNEPVETVKKSKAYAVTWSKKIEMNQVDKQYHDLLEEIIEKGTRKQTRSGATRSLFDRTMRFNLQDGLPLITTKKVFYKGIIHELLWFLKGDTNIRYLVENNVHIWDDDAYRYYLENRDKLEASYKNTPYSKEEFIEKVKEKKEYVNSDNQKYSLGDLGPVYGRQWRDWDGHDQIAEIVDKLRHHPDDRRIILSAWNVDDLGKMALPPCHMMAVFNTKEMTEKERMNWYYKYHEDCIIPDVVPDEEWLDQTRFPKRVLNCSFVMRSNDFCAGNPYNIAQYAMLVYMLCKVCNLAPGELVYHGIDVHVYENHVEAAREQLKRKGSGVIPKLKFKRYIKDINDFRYEDFDIIRYSPDEPIKYKLNVGLENVC